MEKTIDIIVPCYNTKRTDIFDLLSSVNVQTIKNECIVTLVNDCSTDLDFLEEVENFRQYLEINIVSTDSNGGPGVARQKGIDSTKCKYIIFIDSDDMLLMPFSLEELKNKIESNSNYIMASGDFVEEVYYEEEHKREMLTHSYVNFVWMFGKMYRRSYIEKIKLRFPDDLRTSEDTYFNTVYQLLKNNTNCQIGYVKLPLYLWRWNDNSITRSNNGVYRKIGSDKGLLVGLVKGKDYAYDFVRKIDKYNPNIPGAAAKMFYLFYEEYDTYLKDYPEEAPSKIAAIVEYYKHWVLLYENSYSYKNVLQSCIDERKLKQIQNVLKEDTISFKDFEELLQSKLPEGYLDYKEYTN